MKKNLKLCFPKKIHRKTLYIVIVSLFFLVIVLSISLLVNLNRIKQYEQYLNSVSEYYINREKELNQKEVDINKNIEQGKEDYFVKRLYEILAEDDIMFLAKKQWKYELAINNAPVDLSNGNVINLNEENMVITLKESFNRELLPENIMNYGSISLGNKKNDLQDSLIIRSSYLKDISVNEIKDGIVITYQFSPIPVGEKVVLQISELLRERLNYSVKVIEIVKQ